MSIDNTLFHSCNNNNVSLICSFLLLSILATFKYNSQPLPLHHLQSVSCHSLTCLGNWGNRPKGLKDHIYDIHDVQTCTYLYFVCSSGRFPRFSFSTASLQVHTLRSLFSHQSTACSPPTVSHLPLASSSFSSLTWFSGWWNLLYRSWVQPSPQRCCWRSIHLKCLERRS